jgi:hypothetical protein
MLVAYALTTLANLKEVLGIVDASQDSLLTNTINRATDMIESYCNGRRFASTVYTNEKYDGTGTQLINARHFPITALSAYEYNAGTVGDVDWDSLQDDFISYIDDVAGPGQFYYENGFARGTRNYRFSYTAGYATIPYDLEQACLDLCVFIYNSRSSQGMLSETLGDRSYTKMQFTGNPIDNIGIDLVLEKYRTPTI